MYKNIYLNSAEPSFLVQKVLPQPELKDKAAVLKNCPAKPDLLVKFQDLQSESKVLILNYSLYWSRFTDASIYVQKTRMVLYSKNQSGLPNSKWLCAACSAGVATMKEK